MKIVMNEMDADLFLKLYKSLRMGWTWNVQDAEIENCIGRLGE